MNKLFTLIAAILFSATAFAQNNSGAISACNDPEGGIQIVFDNSLNCSNAPGDFSGLDALGYHSGGTADVNEGWGTGIDWNASGAVTAKNDGNDVFTAYINDPDAYYGVTGIARINFVFNQGPEDGSNPWGSEGKDNNADQTDCQDFYIILADVVDACATTASIRNQVLDLGFSVAPNPMSQSTTIRFDNPTGESFAVKLMGLDGRTVRSYDNVRGQELNIERGDMPAGLYFVNFVNAEGKRASTSLMVK